MSMTAPGSPILTRHDHPVAEAGAASGSPLGALGRRGRPLAEPPIKPSFSLRGSGPRRPMKGPDVFNDERDGHGPLAGVRDAAHCVALRVDAERTGPLDRTRMAVAEAFRSQMTGLLQRRQPPFRRFGFLRRRRRFVNEPRRRHRNPHFRQGIDRRVRDFTAGEHPGGRSVKQMPVFDGLSCQVVLSVGFGLASIPHEAAPTT